eukprot:gene28604-34782_t
MSERVEIDGLKVAKELYDFVANEAVVGTSINADAFFQGLAAITGYTPEQYEAFLREIGYLLPEGGTFSVSTDNVDPEIALTAGPQLVVPVMNARYALNAANARWGSLYDALYGTDAIPETDGAEKGKAFNPLRGAKVIAWAKSFLDDSAPLDGAHWADVIGLSVDHGTLVLKTANGGSPSLKDQAQFVGYKGDASRPSSILLVKNGMHVEIV